MNTPMQFEAMMQRFHAHIDALLAEDPQLMLFETDADPEVVWDLYLNGIPKQFNPVYHTRTIHDCSACRHAMKTLGRLVTIDEDLEVRPLMDFDAGDGSFYQAVLDAVSAYVKTRSITGRFLSPFCQVGTPQSRILLEDGSVVTPSHWNLKLPAQATAARKARIEGEKAKFRDTCAVFQRSLREISEEAVTTVLELVRSNTLYKGEEWQGALTKFLTCKREFDRLPEEKQALYCWKNASQVGIAVGRIRNHSMGTLLTDLTEGMNLDTAVRRYEKIVAPANYKRPKAIFTPKMLEEARATVEELGLTNSLARRFATADDIRVNNILFCNRDAAKRIRTREGTASVFDDLMAEARPSPRRFSRVEEISAEDFVEKVLPTAREVELLMEARFAPNMVSLIAPADPDAPSLFKWDNAFSWAYAGNMTDSDIKRNVKSAGGRVDGVLRFSIQWNDTEKYDGNDLDAHCMEPGGEHIYFGHKGSPATGGNLDVDIIHPTKGKSAVENITYPELRRMKPGRYEFFVHCFTFRGGRGGFQAEVEYEGEIHRFSYNKTLRQNEKVPVADVTLERDGSFSIRTKLPEAVDHRSIWGVKCGDFVPVSVILYSPNYWDGQQGVGHRHYLFMLRDCVNEETPNGFYNEFLKSELEPHKRVFEALGGRMAVETVKDQLSGVGFSATKRNHLTLRVTGSTQRTLKVLF